MMLPYNMVYLQHTYESRFVYVTSRCSADHIENPFKNHNFKKQFLYVREDQKISLGPNVHEPRSSNG